MPSSPHIQTLVAREALEAPYLYPSLKAAPGIV